MRKDKTKSESLKESQVLEDQERYKGKKVAMQVVKIQTEKWGTLKSKEYLTRSIDSHSSPLQMASFTQLSHHLLSIYFNVSSNPFSPLQVSGFAINLSTMPGCPSERV